MLILRKSQEFLAGMFLKTAMRALTVRKSCYKLGINAIEEGIIKDLQGKMFIIQQLNSQH